MIMYRVEERYGVGPWELVSFFNHRGEYEGDAEYAHEESARMMLKDLADACPGGVRAGRYGYALRVARVTIEPLDTFQVVSLPE